MNLGAWFYAALWLIGVYLILQFLPVKEWSLELSAFAHNLGLKGAVVFALIFILASVCLLPCAFLTFSAGVAYGWMGLPLVMVSAIIGATISFFIARHFFSRQVTRLIAKRTNTKALALTVENGGWKAMLLLRLSPMIPFNVTNYFLGTVKVNYCTYIAVMIFGTLPLTTLFVYLGSLGKELKEGKSLQMAFLIAGVFATVLFLQQVVKTRMKLLSKTSVRACEPHG